MSTVEVKVPNIGDFKDVDGLRTRAEQVRRAGYRGMLAIHPAQVDVINQAFTPNAEAIAEYAPDLVVLSDDLNGIVDECLHFVQLRAAEAGVEVRLDLAPEAAGLLGHAVVDGYPVGVAQMRHDGTDSPVLGHEVARNGVVDALGCLALAG